MATENNTNDICTEGLCPIIRRRIPGYCQQGDLLTSKDPAEQDAAAQRYLTCPRRAINKAKYPDVWKRSGAK